jgi:hypothetical protein
MDINHDTDTSIHPRLHSTNKRMRHRRSRPAKEQKKAEILCYPSVQSFTSYTIYFINHTTVDVTMEYLIEHATHTKLFTISTKGDSVADIPALIQIECVGDPSTILLIECWHLPDSCSHLFRQISRLFTAIFDSTKGIQGWGDLSIELKKFVRFDLFKTLDIQHTHFLDIQYLFRDWYNGIFPHSEDCCPSEVPNLNEDSIYLHPTDFDLNLSLSNEQYDYLSCSCPYRPYKNPNDHWDLPTAINKTFQEFLDDTYASSPWGLGLNVLLGTYIPTDLVGRPRYLEIKKQKHYRRQLIEYAALDCLSITKLSVAIRHRWSKQELEHYLQGTHTHDDPSDVLNTESFNIPPPISVNNPELSVPPIEHIHHTTDHYEPISDDDIMDVINSAINVSTVHSSIDTPPAIPTQRLIVVNRTKKRSQEAIRRRCQKRNAVRRAHRHDFDIIRTVYRLFKIQQIEQVLNQLQIRRRHCFIRRHYQLHIGCHSSEDRIRYNDILNGQYFTQSHYDKVFGPLSLSFHDHHVPPDT